MTLNKARIIKYLIHTFAWLIGIIIFFNVVIIAIQFTDKSNRLKLAIDQSSVDDIKNIGDLDYNLLIDSEPAIFYVIESNNKELITHFLQNNVDLQVVIERNKIKMEPGYFARYFDKKLAEDVLMSTGLKHIQASILEAQSKLDSEFSEGIMELVDKDQKILDKAEL